MQKVAQSWLVLTIAGSSSAFFLGLDSFLGEAPILLFTLVGGVVADRRDRRQLLLMSQYVQMTTAFTLAGLVYWDVVRIWHVLTLSVITGIVAITYPLRPIHLSILSWFTIGIPAFFLALACAPFRAGIAQLSATRLTPPCGFLPN